VMTVRLSSEDTETVGDDTETVGDDSETVK
jgi:hypothetical protein